jgi:hypothetical protein
MIIFNKFFYGAGMLGTNSFYYLGVFYGELPAIRKCILNDAQPISCSSVELNKITLIATLDIAIKRYVDFHLGL